MAHAYSCRGVSKKCEKEYLKLYPVCSGARFAEWLHV